MTFEETAGVKEISFEVVTTWKVMTTEKAMTAVKGMIGEKVIVWVVMTTEPETTAVNEVTVDGEETVERAMMAVRSPMVDRYRQTV